MVTRLSERIYRTEGIVLRQLELGEADRILTLYTPQYGKLRAMAKGIRRPASKLRGHLELFTRTKLSVRKKWLHPGLEPGALLYYVYLLLFTG